MWFFFFFKQGIRLSHLIIFCWRNPSSFEDSSLSISLKAEEDYKLPLKTIKHKGSPKEAWQYYIALPKTLNDIFKGYFVSMKIKYFWWFYNMKIIHFFFCFNRPIQKLLMITLPKYIALKCFPSGLFCLLFNLGAWTHLENGSQWEVWEVGILLPSNSTWGKIGSFVKWTQSRKSRGLGNDNSICKVQNIS